MGRGRRVVPPGEVLRLAAFVAARTHADATVIEHDLEKMITCTDEDGDMKMVMGKTGVASCVPEWMLEYEQLSATPALHLDNAPFIAARMVEDSTYTGPYREDATDVTLQDMGLDPAIFRR